MRPRSEGRHLLDEHLAWNFRQQGAGRVLFSGPTADGQIGIMVLRAGSAAAARTIMDDEPFVRHGFRQYELYEWEVHQVLGVGAFSKENIDRIKAEPVRRQAPDKP